VAGLTHTGPTTYRSGNGGFRPKGLNRSRDMGLRPDSGSE